MKEVQKLAAQGDVLFRRLPGLPWRAVEQRRSGPLVVAHSETGHHHVIREAAVRLFREPDGDPLVAILAVEGAFADVEHLRAHDTHETLRLLQGYWEVRRQREWAPEGWRRVED